MLHPAGVPIASPVMDVSVLLASILAHPKDRGDRGFESAHAFATQVNGTWLTQERGA